MSSELLGALIAMILGIVWVSVGFGSAVLVGILGLIGYLCARYGKLFLTQAISELMSALNIDQRKN
ncbi:hypothetical protein FEZ51_05715 [Pediococcus stilesii]|uniref:DUF2273 domain-containing protein n=1 Tax=Pediococcus stilesii TaxID=331679 RepID=A0A5R9BUC9_9LACO|nr:hypothetical protein [Pediococcus stilesii]TLQ04296.1 hypothetical protein FEZ51_05715 [Pediococcus stilesii]